MSGPTSVVIAVAVWSCRTRVLAQEYQDLLVLLTRLRPVLRHSDLK
jgi:hypothetical protein